MMKLRVMRYVGPKLLVLLAFALLPNPAYAGTLTSAFSIYSIMDAGGGGQGVLVTPASPATVDNSSGCAVYEGYTLAASDANYKEKLALLTAAFLGNRQIKIWLTQTSGDCVFSRPRIDTVIVYN